jgi:hypothetical protein
VLEGDEVARLDRRRGVHDAEVVDRRGLAKSKENTPPPQAKRDSSAAASRRRPRVEGKPPNDEAGPASRILFA